MKLNSGWIIGIACLACGVCLGVLFSNFQYFVFEPEISWFDLISFIVTTTVGIYVALVVGKAFTRHSSEKTLLTSEIKDSIAAVKKIIGKIDQRTYFLKEMSAEIKSLNEDLHLLEKLISQSHCSRCTTADIRKVLVNLRRQATNFSTGPNNNVSLSNSQYSALSVLGKLLKQRYFELLFKINQA